MNKFNNGLKFNQLLTVKYNSSILKTIKQMYLRIGARPIILDQEQKALGVLENSFDIELDQEVNSLDELVFSLPFADSKREFLKNENIIQMFDTLYIIREVSMKKGSSTPLVEVFAEALWYDLQFSDPLETREFDNETAYKIIENVLSNTDWTIGSVEIQTRRNISFDEETDNVLKALQKIRNLYGGELKFDTVNKRVSLLRKEAKHSGASIVYKKNMEEIIATYDTRNLVTRLYAYGKNGLTIEAANNGLKYVENYEYTKTRRVRTIKDERFTNPYHLKEYVEKQLDLLSVPSSSYSVTAQDLSTLSGMSHEKFYIGSIVRVYDKELGLDLNTQIVSWVYNVAEPWLTRIELEVTSKSLSELLAGDQSGNGYASSQDSLDNQQIIDLMVFNYLLNSRSDDGFSYWSNSGWNIDVTDGYSGEASFKTTGELGKKKELKQTVYPSHRDSYSVSFRSKSKDLKKGPNGKVGINVKVTFQDGTTENKFIPLA